MGPIIAHYRLPNLQMKVLQALKSHNNLCEVWILLRSVENAEIEDSSELIPTLILWTEMLYN